MCPLCGVVATRALEDVRLVSMGAATLGRGDELVDDLTVWSFAASAPV
jgi:hypothetical protein